MTSSKPGRPPHVPLKETQDMVETLSGFGIPQPDIAKLIGIDPKTLRLHYAEQIELGSIKSIAKVAENLFTLACKPNREGLQAAIFWLRVRAHWSEYSPRPPMMPEPLGVDMYGLARHPFESRSGRKDDFDEQRRPRYSAQVTGSQARRADRRCFQDLPVFWDWAG